MKQNSPNAQLNPKTEAGLPVAATPRRRKVLATPSSPVDPASFPASEKMRRRRRRHTVATRRHRYPRPATSVFGLKRDLRRLLRSMDFVSRHPALKRGGSDASSPGGGGDAPRRQMGGGEPFGMA
jgi:hypothetical protein